MNAWFEYLTDRSGHLEDIDWSLHVNERLPFDSKCLLMLAQIPVYAKSHCLKPQPVGLNRIRRVSGCVRQGFGCIPHISNMLPHDMFLSPSGSFVRPLWALWISLVIGKKQAL